MSPDRCRPLRGVGDLDEFSDPRWPRDGDDSDERELHEANRSARAESTTALQSLLPAEELTARVNTSTGGEVFRGTVPPEFAAEFLAPDLVDRLLGHHDQRPPRLRPMQDRVPLDAASYASPRAYWSGSAVRARVGRLAGLVADDGTVSIDGADELDPGLSRLAEHLERVFGGRVLANVYVADGRSTATGYHWDDHDVFVFQLLGTRRWELRRPVSTAPVRPWNDADPESATILAEEELREGDLLYLPRGTPHEVSPCGELSVHVTLGVTRPRAHEAMVWAAGRTVEIAAFRHDLPAAPANPGHDDGVALGEQLTRPPFADVLTRYGSYVRARYPLRTSSHFLAQERARATGDWSGVTVRLAAPGHLHVEALGDEEVVVATGGRRLRVARHAVAALARLHSARGIPGDSLRVECPSTTDCAAEFLAALSDEDLLEVHEG